MKKKISALFILFAVFIVIAGENAPNLAVGDKAPAFQAVDDQGQNFDSRLLLGKQNLVVYFYPAAMTGGCTAQACAFRDDREEFKKLNTVVVGVSGDSVQNLVAFKKVNQLNFPLLADPDGAVARAFGVPTKAGGEITRTVDDRTVKLVRGVTEARWTFVIDKSGKIIYKDMDVKAADDSRNVIEFLSSRGEKSN